MVTYQLLIQIFMVIKFSLNILRNIRMIFVGAHPFHINLEVSKKNQIDAHGQFFLNSNAMDIDLQPLPALTYTTIGGIIDLYIFTGPTMENVIEQYWTIVGVSFSSK